PRELTGHPGSRTTSFIQRGKAGQHASWCDAATTEHWYYISGIEVRRVAAARAVVALGDSITDGRGSTTDGNDRWPDGLAKRLQENATTAGIAVLNQGIG